MASAEKWELYSRGVTSKVEQNGRLPYALITETAAQDGNSRTRRKQPHKTETAAQDGNSRTKWKQPHETETAARDGN